MGIFDFLTKDPTDSWGSQSIHKFTFDISNGSMNGLTFYNRQK